MDYPTHRYIAPGTEDIPSFLLNLVQIRYSDTHLAYYMDVKSKDLEAAFGLPISHKEYRRFWWTWDNTGNLSWREKLVSRSEAAQEGLPEEYHDNLEIAEWQKGWNRPAGI